MTDRKNGLLRVAYKVKRRLSLLLLVACSAAQLSAQVASLPDIILDSEQTTGIAPHSITVSGNWQTTSLELLRHGASYLHDNNSHGVNKWVRYTPAIPAGQGGWYRVYLWNAANSTHANNVEVQVAESFGNSAAPVVNTRNRQLNQRQNAGYWYLLGTFHFIEGSSGSVTIKTTRSDGAVVNGYVLADAVRFTRVAPEVVIDSQDATGVTLTGTWGLAAC